MTQHSDITNKFIYSIFLFGLYGFLFLQITNSSAQTNLEKNLYSLYDAHIGKDNLPIANGILHTNPYQTKDQNTRYYIEDKYSKENVTYKNQDYFDVPIKYDLLSDNIIYKLPESNTMGCELTKGLVSKFTLNHLNFILLKDFETFFKLKTGYYQKCYAGKNLNLLKKHQKLKRDIYHNGKVLSEFYENNEFYLQKDSVYYPLNSQKNVIQIFPDYKKKIKDFYSTNKEQEKKNKTSFLENLIAYLDKIISNS